VLRREILTLLICIAMSTVPTAWGGVLTYAARLHRIDHGDSTGFLRHPPLALMSA
jgi:hypothetical protein